MALTRWTPGCPCCSGSDTPTGSVCQVCTDSLPTTLYIMYPCADAITVYKVAPNTWEACFTRSTYCFPNWPSELPFYIGTFKYGWRVQLINDGVNCAFAIAYVIPPYEQQKKCTAVDCTDGRIPSDWVNGGGSYPVGNQQEFQDCRDGIRRSFGRAFYVNFPGYYLLSDTLNPKVGVCP